MKRFMTMTLAALAFVVSMSSCSKDDDASEVAVAEQVAGTYSGNEIVMVMGEESSNETKIYSFEKVTDTSVDMLIPEMGMGGHMSIPALQVKNIPLKKNGNTIGGELASYAGTVINADGAEKAFTITGLVILIDGNNIAVTYSLKYGNMPMSMETTLIGTKK
ncbi:MAG: hypothetical protein IJ185_01840 [Prevotella sp.]|nr:hypothetical protein [Prevotella sp.]MBQ9260833.1 hypothetical protein [Prevotella sp.]